ncbi:hypothetical protein K1719_014356 [Acacia pycnantha]|nr:hypothetical protein K1719_014356 [Acacia pycnantha]
MGKKRKDRTPETANNVGGESSSTSRTLNSSPECKYDVFLSFAGKDSRFKFTDHLYEAFSRSGITFVVISKNYAKSTWCLDELQKILRCRKKLGRSVFPIFYNVDPADVRKQRKSFGKAFAKHEEKFKENTTKVQSWRTALSKISKVSGWDTRGKYSKLQYSGRNP